MSDQPELSTSGRGLKKKILSIAVALMVIFAAVILLVNPFLNTPYVATRVSAFLSDHLRQKTVVEGLRFSGGSIMAIGVSIVNPQGFPAGNLIKVGYLEISPDWRSIVMGKRDIRSIRIHGLHAALLRNKAGEWNFSNFSSQFKGKKGGEDIIVGELRLDGECLSVDGRMIKDITLAVRDISTKGSTTARMGLSFKDENGSSYHIDGNGRLGDSPAFEMKLTAPAISLKYLNGYRIPIDTEKGKGGLELSLTFGNEELKFRGEARVDPLIVKIGDETCSHRAGLTFTGRYLLRSDQSLLDSADLRLDDGSIRLQARGVVDKLREEKDFSLEISHQGIQLADIFQLVPSNITRGFQIKGEILPATIKVKGREGAGIASASADIVIRRITVSRDDRLLVENLCADANVTAQSDGWRLIGRVSQRERSGAPLLLFKDIPFNMQMDRHFRPTNGGIPSFSAELAGVPARGSVLFEGKKSESLSVRAEIGKSSLAELSHRLQLKGFDLTKGSVIASARCSGSLTGKLQSDISAAISGLQGIWGGRRVALGLAKANVSIKGDHGSVNGSARITADHGDIDGRRFSFSVPVGLHGDVITVVGAEGQFDKALIRPGKLAVSFPGGIGVKAIRENGIRMLLRLEGGNISREGYEAGDVNGDFRATLSTSNRRLQVVGDGFLKVQSLLYGGKRAGALSARYRANAGRGTMDVTGDILGGRLAGSATADLKDFRNGGGFSIKMEGVSGSFLTEIAGKGYPFRLSTGNFDLASNGRFDGANGLSSSFTFVGKDIALSAKSGKTLFSGGAVAISGDLAKGDVSLNEGLARIGDKFRVGIRGNLKSVASPQREGDFSMEMPRVGVATLLDIFANALPPSLQEAEANGSVEITSVIKTKGKSGRISGTIKLEDMNVEVPSQKLNLSGIRGDIPLDIDISGKIPQRLNKWGLKRENYKQFLSQFQTSFREGNNFVIERIRFGTTEMADTRLLINAADGITEIKSFKSRLFHGDILGRGSIYMTGGGRFGGDFLVHDLSLSELCNSYPGIKGYMSGRVDGFASIYGEGKTLDTIKGFMEFWTRTGDGERMLISKDFLQKLSGKKLKGMFFTNDRPYDRGEIEAYLEDGYLTFQTMDISHTNFFGMRDLSVTVAPIQNKISIDHLLASIREAASRGKAAKSGGEAGQPAPATEFKWEE